jgi:23S rRNA (adenine2503-C2)-methyltransferase
VTFEYTLLAGINDAPAQAAELARLLRSYGLMSHVNLIPWNPVDEADVAFSRPKRGAVLDFKAELERAGVPVSVRVTRGLEAAAACGQLRNMHQKSPMPGFPGAAAAPAAAEPAAAAAQPAAAV